MGNELPQTTWKLIRTDTPYTVFTAQFLPEDYSEDVNTTWGETKIPRRVEPISQWLSGESETATFTAQFFNTGAILDQVRSAFTNPQISQQDLLFGRDVKKDVEALRKCIKPDPKLGRPPTFTFEWGNDIRYQCIVTGIGGVKYGELWRFGQIRSATFAITLRKITVDFALERVDPSAKPHDSLYRATAQGATYEDLAAREYGRPEFGIYLRQRNSAAFPRTGEIVRLPVADRFASLRRAPKNFALSEDPLARAARLATIDARTGSRDLPFLT